ncbi:DUF1298 domain-containing protein [Mycolicibacterium sp. CH28]|uniref:DUF1298 domain-containing protein n=1 Tax=Mycolicibacterium sp. CH28 TaxID=2512237 RepID=UPI0010804252|nr:DUF1298 domain-containing protein [Mycolicibacterium sp. CH28]TGD85629.1 DUF1298 domain-containing protein [Mycolicibacterium sp. CH28]
MTAVDAQMLWISATIPNDQFLLYAFDGALGDPGAVVGELRRRAQACDELRLRVVEQGALRYPRWQRGAVGDDQFAVHGTGGLDWAGCLDETGRLTHDQLDLHHMSWRAHIFPRVAGVPGVDGAGSVVVVQIGHALGDGNRSAALAGVLLGRSWPVPVPAGARRGFLPIRAVAAARAHRRLVRDIEAGLMPPPMPPRPVLSVNQRPRAVPVIRTIALRRDQLGGPTVTVAALAVIGEALAGYLVRRGEDPSRLGAEVPMAGADRALAHNNFRNVGIGLYPDLERPGRAAAIAGDLAVQRRRGQHPAMRTSAASFAAVPAPLLRWGVGQLDADARSDTVTGNTVVSSVNRGPADLSVGGCPVVLTAGFPGLSPMMSLTHGVHGIGKTIALSVHADPGNVDVDDYLAGLRAALDV